MPKKVPIAILAATIACSSQLQAQVRVGPQVPEPASIKVPADGVTVPMQDMGGRPVVELRINGKGPFPFILDTGATMTVISEELSRQLSLSAPGDMHVVARGAGTPPRIVAIHEVRIGNAVLEDVIAGMMPSGAFSVGGDAPRGVLTAASFPGYLLTYDYRGKRISIKKGSLAGADSKSIFQYSEDHLLPTVPIRVAGHDTQVDLDTGSPYGLTLPVKFLTELPLATEPKESGKVRTGGGGEFPVSIARVHGVIEVGKYKLDAGEVSFSDARPGPGPSTGNIGYEVLRHFVVTIDSKNRRIELDQ
ncbi:MAG: aspartyl protease family protein [Chthoniobacterales bacterium]